MGLSQVILGVVVNIRTNVICLCTTSGVRSFNKVTETTKQLLIIKYDVSFKNLSK